jgi:hypothetical protein
VTRPVTTPACVHAGQALDPGTIPDSHLRNPGSTTSFSAPGTAARRCRAGRWRSRSSADVGVGDDQPDPGQARGCTDHPARRACLASRRTETGAPNGGSRATAAASDHRVARPTFLSVSEPIADYGRRTAASPVCVTARRFTSYGRLLSSGWRVVRCGGASLVAASVWCCGWRGVSRTGLRRCCP